MKPLALPNLVMASVCFTVAFYEFLTWLRVRGRLRDLAFAATSLGGALFNLACAGEYNVALPVESIPWLRMQAVTLNLTGLAFLWYFSEQTAQVKRRAVALFALLLGLGSLAQIIGLGDLTWAAGRTAVKSVSLPLGLRAVYLEVDSGPLTDVSYYLGVLLLAYLLRVALLYRRSGARRESVPLFWMLGIVALAYLSDFAVDEGLYRFPFTMEYAWLAVVVLVGQQRSREMLEAVAAKRALQASEARLLASLEEKDLLLKEIHHRVKNNLQIISSILFLQARRVDDPSFRALLQDCRNQVASMALIHEDLYRSKDFRNVDFTAYVRTLLSRLIGSYRGEGSPGSRIDAEDMRLGIDTAIPCGLIVNELCTNAIKHAFPPDRAVPDPEVRVLLRRLDSGRILIGVSDNGVGLPEDFDLSVTASFGMRIIGKLAEQLGAELSVARAVPGSRGAGFELVVPCSVPAESP